KKRRRPEAKQVKTIRICGSAVGSPFCKSRLGILQKSDVTLKFEIQVKTCGGVFWLRQCFCYGNMRDNKDQMTVSVIRSRPWIEALRFNWKIN
ncbi:hypothetical protein T03_16202, partial [Trichinella britovi]